MNPRALAKLLLKESFSQDANLDFARVSAVCEYVDANLSQTKKLPVLREYLKLVRPELSREEALVELSGDIGDASFEQIKLFILRETAKPKLRFEKRVKKSLLGGVRITCGDNIWERSAKSSLESLKAALK